MNKTLLAFIVAGVGLAGAVSILTKKEQLNSEEQEKIKETKAYLEEKGYVVVSKKEYTANKLNLFSVANIPTYYKAAKTVAKFVL